MNEKTLKLIKWVLSWVLFLGLFILASQTCPTKSAHERIISETVRKEVKRQAMLEIPSEANPFSAWFVERASSWVAKKTASYIKRLVTVDNFWVFSIGSISTSDGVHLMSFGAFDHVFVFPMYVGAIARSIIAENENA